MASMGLKYMAWADIAGETTTAVPTYNAGLVLGKAVSVNVSVSNAEGEVYADDALAEYISEFSSGELTAEVDNISLENQAKLYGATYASDEFTLEPTDSAPHGGVGGIQVLLVNNTRKFRAWFFPKVRASMPDWDAATKGSSISFGTQPIKMKIMAPAYGPWYYVKEFTTEAAAKAYIDTKLGVATWYTVEVQVNGAGEGEAATPVGVTAVASEGAFVLTITGTATALYDNGTDKIADVSAGKYTLASVVANHKIALIF
jgi:hypothetical protein